MLLANSYGWWGLAGILVVLAIHFLQQRSRRIEIATLFLLQFVQASNTEGRSFDRIRNSIPLWLQLLCASLLTFLLLDPRWLRDTASRRAAIVIDASLSMDAFRSELARLVPAAMQELRSAAGPIEWIVLSSDSTKPPLYSGGDFAKVQSALAAFEPQLLSHDFAPALREARKQVGSSGRVLLVSDREQAVPADVDVIAIGRVLDNVGLTAAQVVQEKGETYWKASIRNFGPTEQTRTWHVELDGSNTADRQITLAPQQVLTLRGAYPEKAARIKLVLSDDAFGLDNSAPLVRPQPKLLRVRIAVDAPAQQYMKDFFQIEQPVEFVGAMHLSHLAVRSITGQEDLLPSENAVYFASDPNAPQSASTAYPTPARHPLLIYLNWQSLLVRTTFPVPSRDTDEVLVWLDNRPLIFLRREAVTKEAFAAAALQSKRSTPRESTVSKLIFNFNPDHSNAAKVPAFALLLHRFVSEVRNQHVGLHRENFEANQLLELALPDATVDAKLIVEEIGKQTKVASTVPQTSAAFLRAPSRPAFFSVEANGETLEDSASSMADATESDFQTAATFNHLQSQLPAVTLESSVQDFLKPLWIVLFAAALLASWHFAAEHRFRVEGL